MTTLELNASCLIESFISNRTADARYASFDYCYNYFEGFSTCSQEISSRPNRQTSCLHLWSYLASWGMLRGSSRLLQCSMRHLLPLIDLIGSGKLDALWRIDCDQYNSDNLPQLIGAYNLIAQKVADANQQLILVTKIMLGVFGCCPAFDTQATASLWWLFGGRCGFRRFNHEALLCVGDSNLANKETIDCFANKTVTLDFDSRQPTQRKYPKAKILDMILFQANWNPHNS